MTEFLTDSDREKMGVMAKSKYRDYNVKMFEDSHILEGISSPIHEHICQFLQDLYDDGEVSVYEIQQHIGTTGVYHVLDNCTHTKRVRVTQDRCNVIRCMAQDEIKYSEMDDILKDVSPQQARYHATGQCTHDNEIEPVGDRRQTEYHICEHCGTTFPDNYQRNRFCSHRCHNEHKRSNMELQV